MFMDVSSEMIHALLPVFLVSSLGASATAVGIIEGLGEGTASISKLFSGWLSDRMATRKLLAVIGYGLGTLSKPVFALAPSAFWVGAARFSDRLGKGIRGAPRDALVADLTPPEARGAAYGLRQSLDTVGAFAGPLLAILLMARSGNDFRLVFRLALLPGLIAVLVLIFGVSEPERRLSATKGPPIRWSELRRFGVPFRSVVAVGAILTLARFSEAFLILRAQNVGLPLALTPLVLVLMNAVYAATAYPVGAISDRVGRTALLAPGFVTLALADIVLAGASGIGGVMAGIALWGLHMGITQGVLAAMVADSAPEDLRGSAFGLFNLVTGVATLFASFIAGVLWQAFGPGATFLSGAVITSAGLLAGISTRAVRIGRN
jgi:MFS family permease